MSNVPRIDWRPLCSIAVALWLLGGSLEPNAVCGQQLAEGGAASAEALQARGQRIYQAQCATCHGKQGEGVAEHHPDPLAGDASVGELAQQIAETMPEDEPERCTGEDARAVAAFIHEAFYSEAARIRNRPPRIALARLTGSQLRQSLADLYAHFEGSMWSGEKPGVRGQYFDGARWKTENRKIDRVDPVLDFDFGDAGPGEGINAQDFFIQWRGGVRADVSGRYEIVVRCSCAFICNFGGYDREFINNRVQSGDQTEFRRVVQLTGGRVYPLQIDFFQRKRKTKQPPARISLCWVPPHGTEQVIPSRNLLAASAPPVFALQTKLPPDDRSYGYDRGIAVDRQWDDAVTAAALEFAQVVNDELWPRYRRKQTDSRSREGRRGRSRNDAGAAPNTAASSETGADADDPRALLRQFLSELVGAAFREPLDSETRLRYIDQQVDATSDDGEAIKRCVLIAIKSPRFLYPLLDSSTSRSQQAANRLALTLYDSLPSDPWLRDLIRQDQLESPEQIRQAARRMVSDYRTQGKVRELMYAWLNLEHLGELSKSQESFPDFNADLKSDLRSAFDALLDDLVWSDASDYRQLFQASWAYTTPLLAEYYGSGWQALPEPTDGGAEAGSDAQTGQSEQGRGGEAKAGSAGETAPPAADAGKSEADGGESEADGDGWLAGRRLNLQRTGEASGQRLGILTHPYLMSRLAYEDSTSPIHRGVFLIRYLLGRTLRPPQEAFTPLSPALHPDLTTRERVSLQTSPQSCQVCHSKINGLGFALENFDAVGRYRDQERRQTIDASGFYATRDDRLVKLSGPRQLAELLANGEDAQRAFVNRAFQHLVKQPPAAYGGATLDRLTETFRGRGCSIRELLVEIAVTAASPPQDPLGARED